MIYNLDGMKLITRRNEDVVDIPRMFAFLLGVLAAALMIDSFFGEQEIGLLFHGLNAVSSVGMFAWKY